MRQLPGRDEIPETHVWNAYYNPGKRDEFLTVFSKVALSSPALGTTNLTFPTVPIPIPAPTDACRLYLDQAFPFQLESLVAQLPPRRRLRDASFPGVPFEATWAPGSHSHASARRPQGPHSRRGPMGKPSTLQHERFRCRRKIVTEDSAASRNALTLRRGRCDMPRRTLIQR